MSSSRAPAALGLGAFALLVAGASFETGAAPLRFRVPPASSRAPATPGPAPRHRTFDAAATNAQCEACHPDVAREWRSSLHRQSHTDPTYQAQFAKEPLAFCTGCHAPEANADAPVPPALSQLGVGCVTCHVVGDAILAAKVAPATAKAAPHALDRSGALEEPSACAHCHEFAFPESSGRKNPLLMQSTMTEHRASPFAGQTCASCHMPTVGTGKRAHRSHTFAASRDTDLIRSAIRIEEEMKGGALELTLHPDRVGHAFPTGDLLRRLRLVIEVRDAAGAAVEHFERLFVKRIGMVHAPNAAPRKVMARDDRVGAGPGPVVVRFIPRTRPPGGSIHYTLRYERVGDPSGGPGGTALIDGTVSLADRTLGLP